MTKYGPVEKAGFGRKLRTMRQIPLIEAANGGAPAMLDGAPEQIADILRVARKRYGPLALRLGDRLSKRWLARTENPYFDEIHAVSRHLGVAGAYLLNMSYEWACTSGVGPAPGGEGSRLLRTLDWDLAGLGRNLIVAHQHGPAGAYYNIGWPGFAGVTTAMAPGRFAIAINQPPMRQHHRSFPINWARNRWGVWRGGGVPPVHALRHVCDHCPTAAAARDYLMTVALCLPGFFTISGADAGEGCVIERSETRSAVLEGPTAIANHWRVLTDEGGQARGENSEDRLAQMEALREGAADDLGWLAPPILNATTRAAVVANAATGTLIVQGFEPDGPATKIFRLSA